ncbi:hypothetical protein JG688_00009693, partial [Phytophthora aleatoria]
SLGSGASASSITFSGSATNGSGESVDDASGVVKLSSGLSETASSGDASVESGVAATEVGLGLLVLHGDVGGGSLSPSRSDGAVRVSGGSSSNGVGGDVTVSSGDSGSSTPESSVCAHSGSGDSLSLVQGDNNVAGAAVELVGGGVDTKNAAQKVKIAGSANSQGAGGYVSIYRGSSANVGGTVLLTSGSNDLPMTKVDERFDMVSNGAVHYRVVLDN